MAKHVAAQDDLLRAGSVQSSGEEYFEELSWEGAQPTALERFRAFITGPYPTLVSRLVLGGIMLLAGLTKIGVPDTMAASIRDYQMPVPPFLVNIMAVGLPILEVGLGIWLIIGLFTRFSGLIGAVLMAIFTIAITQAWARGLQINCGCFGGAEANSFGLGLVRALGPVGDYLANEKADLPTIARDVVLLLMGVHLFFVPTTWAIDNLRARGASAEAEMEQEAELPA